MKKNQFKFNLGVSIFGLAFMLMSSLLLSGCKEDISTEAYATKTEPTLIDKIDEKAAGIGTLDIRDYAPEEIREKAVSLGLAALSGEELADCED